MDLYTLQSFARPQLPVAMLTLALDTALQACSIAILRGKDVAVENFNLLEKGHAEVLPPMVARGLEQAGIGAAQLDRIVVTTGPGGFTGIRVGLAFARALGIGTSARVVGINSLSALRASHIHQGPCACVINARRGEVFAALYSPEGEVIIPPFAATPEDALSRLHTAFGDTPLQLIGDGAPLLPTHPNNWTTDKPDAQICPVALAHLGQNVDPQKNPPDPIYLRAPDAKKSAAPLFAGLIKQ